MRVAFVASEAVPFAKTGGLGDVIGVLPKALKALGHEVIVVIPFYRQVREYGANFKVIIPDFEMLIGERREAGSLLKTSLDEEIPLYLIKHDRYYDREFLYGTPAGSYPDNGERFLYFCRATLEALRLISFSPNLIHCHDWHTGLIPPYLKTLFSHDQHFEKTATLYTLHNLAYQGAFSPELFPLTGLPSTLFTPQGLEFWGQINFMKGGIIFADLINTVSERYSQEIQTPEYGEGLEGALGDRRDDLFGILNGVDYAEWNPATDPYIVAQYNASDLSGKARCRADLLDEYGLSDPEGKPIIGVISRLADQKGFDLVAAVIDQIMELGIGLIVLGTGEQQYHDLFQAVGARYPGRAGIKIAFDNRLAHKIEAGCDMFLMPSRYEPCGLNQIYSLKYGTIPIVRATGGLDDTIDEYDPLTEKGNGVKFSDYSGEALLSAVTRAVALFLNEKKSWFTLMRRAMSADFSWERSAQKYETLYRKALTKLERDRRDSPL